MLLLEIENEELLMLEFLLNERSHEDRELSFDELIVDLEVTDIDLEFLNNHVVIVVIVVIVVVIVDGLRVVQVRLVVINEIRVKLVISEFGVQDEVSLFITDFQRVDSEVDDLLWNRVDQ